MQILLPIIIKARISLKSTQREAAPGTPYERGRMLCPPIGSHITQLLERLHTQLLPTSHLQRQLPCWQKLELSKASLWTQYAITWTAVNSPPRETDISNSPSHLNHSIFIQIHFSGLDHGGPAIEKKIVKAVAQQLLSLRRC